MVKIVDVGKIIQRWFGQQWTWGVELAFRRWSSKVLDILGTQILNVAVVIASGERVIKIVSRLACRTQSMSR